VKFKAILMVALLAGLAAAASGCKSPITPAHDVGLERLFTAAHSFYSTQPNAVLTTYQNFWDNSTSTTIQVTLWISNGLAPRYNTSINTNARSFASIEDASNYIHGRVNENGNYMLKSTNPKDIDEKNPALAALNTGSCLLSTYSTSMEAWAISTHLLSTITT